MIIIIIIIIFIIIIIIIIISSSLSFSSSSPLSSHSLDHRNLRDVIPDPLVFVGARPEFISMMEMDMYIWSCFAIDIPILGGKYLFPRKVSKHHHHHIFL
jgi:hypothetical protein